MTHAGRRCGKSKMTRTVIEALQAQREVDEMLFGTDFMSLDDWLELVHRNMKAGKGHHQWRDEEIERRRRVKEITEELERHCRVKETTDFLQHYGGQRKHLVPSEPVEPYRYNGSLRSLLKYLGSKEAHK